VVVVDGTYDDAVARAASDAAARGWQPLSDTAYPGYTEIPGWVMEGYSTLFVEADQQIRAQCLRRPNTVALQAGVGGLACAGVRHYGRDAYLIVVEPVESDCCMTSICSPDGQPQPSAGRQDSLMAGLNAGMPSLAAWPDLRRGVNCFLTIEDHWAEEAMRALSAGDPQIRAGEAGAAGLAGLLALCQDPAFAAAKERLALHRDSCIMLIVSEGDTDPASFARICRTPSPVT
jgi:diaminopropionate ammonia-lyase